MISLTWNLMKQNKLMNKDIQTLRSIEEGKVGVGEISAKESVCLLPSPWTETIRW